MSGGKGEEKSYIISLRRLLNFPQQEDRTLGKWCTERYQPLLKTANRHEHLTLGQTRLAYMCVALLPQILTRSLSRIRLVTHQQAYASAPGLDTHSGRYSGHLLCCAFLLAPFRCCSFSVLVACCTGDEDKGLIACAFSQEEHFI